MGTNPLVANRSYAGTGTDDVRPGAAGHPAGGTAGHPAGRSAGYPEAHIAGSSAADRAGSPATHIAGRRFVAIARRAGRELEPATTLDAVVRIAELVPQSATVPAWCESAGSAADLVQRLADCFESLARRAEFASAAVSFAVVLA